MEARATGRGLDHFSARFGLENVPVPFRPEGDSPRERLQARQRDRPDSTQRQAWSDMQRVRPKGQDKQTLPCREIELVKPPKRSFPGGPTLAWQKRGRKGL